MNISRGWCLGWREEFPILENARPKLTGVLLA